VFKIVGRIYKGITKKASYPNYGERCYYLKVVHGISQPSIPLPVLGETAVCSFFIAKIDRNDIIRLWKQKLKI